MSNAFLAFGQLLSALGCLASVGYPFVILLVGLRDPATNQILAPRSWDALFALLLGSAVAFGYNGAMFVVFTRVKKLPRSHPNPSEKPGRESVLHP